MNDDNIDSIIKNILNIITMLNMAVGLAKKAYKRIYQAITMKGFICYLQYDNQSTVGYYKELDD